MARSRNIKPGFFVNEALVELDFGTRLLFVGLWTAADREGRLEDRPKKLKIAIFPADAVDVDQMLQSLHDAGFIARYQVDGSRYIQVVNWAKHQNPHHTEKASEIPGANGEITVKAPSSPRQAPKSDGGNPADSRFLIPDSLIPEEGAKAPVGKADLPACRTQEIVDAYHEALPEMPSVKLMNDGRRKAIAKLWRWVLTSTKTDGTRRATTADEATGWVKGYFQRVRDNDFLMGRGQRASAHEGWRCDLDFLLTDRGMKHVIEKTGEAA